MSEIQLPEQFKQIRVVDKSGKPTTIDDYDTFMQFLMQASATSQLVKLRKLEESRRKLEESKVPLGVKPLKLTVLDTVMKILLSPPWISLSMINDGVGAVTIWVNDETDPLQESMVASGEAHEIDMEYPVIDALFLKAALGTTAAVRIYGKEGLP